MFIVHDEDVGNSLWLINLRDFADHADFVAAPPKPVSFSIRSLAKPPPPPPLALLSSLLTAFLCPRSASRGPCRAVPPFHASR